MKRFALWALLFFLPVFAGEPPTSHWGHGPRYAPRKATEPAGSSPNEIREVSPAAGKEPLANTSRDNQLADGRWYCEDGKIHEPRKTVPPQKSDAVKAKDQLNRLIKSGLYKDLEGIALVRIIDSGFRAYEDSPRAVRHGIYALKQLHSLPPTVRAYFADRIVHLDSREGLAPDERLNAEMHCTLSLVYAEAARTVDAKTQRQACDAEDQKATIDEALKQNRASVPPWSDLLSLAFDPSVDQPTETTPYRPELYLRIILGMSAEQRERLRQTWEKELRGKFTECDLMRPLKILESPSSVAKLAADSRVGHLMIDMHPATVAKAVVGNPELESALIRHLVGNPSSGADGVRRALTEEGKRRAEGFEKALESIPEPPPGTLIAAEPSLTAPYARKKDPTDLCAQYRTREFHCISDGKGLQMPARFADEALETQPELRKDWESFEPRCVEEIKMDIAQRVQAWKQGWLSTAETQRELNRILAFAPQSKRGSQLAETVESIQKGMGLPPSPGFTRFISNEEMEQCACLSKVSPELLPRDRTRADRIGKSLECRAVIDAARYFRRQPNALENNSVAELDALVPEGIIGGHVSPLMFQAIRKNNLPLMRHLQELGADLHYNDGAYLEHAAVHGQIEAARYFLQNGVSQKQPINMALHAAALAGHLAIVKLLHDNGGDIHSDNSYALRTAALNGHIEVVRYLISNGAKLLPSDFTTLSNVARRGYPEVVKILINSGANFHYREEELLNQYAYQGDFEMVHFLADRGADIRARRDGPLLNAIMSGSLPTVQFFEEKGADIHGWNGSEEPIRVAAINNKVEIAQYILTKKPKLTDEIYALVGRVGHLEVAKLVFNKESDPRIVLIALKAAAGNRQINVLEYLVSIGADPDVALAQAPSDLAREQYREALKKYLENPPPPKGD